jgi:hypothetical protein
LKEYGSHYQNDIVYADAADPMIDVLAEQERNDAEKQGTGKMEY